LRKRFKIEIYASASYSERGYGHCGPADTAGAARPSLVPRVVRNSIAVFARHRAATCAPDWLDGEPVARTARLSPSDSGFSFRDTIVSVGLVAGRRG
jgi:hypothetical protein